MLRITSTRVAWISAGLVVMAPIGVSQAIAQGTATLTGVVRDSAGRPIGEVDIALRTGSDTVRATARSNRRGEFALTNADSGVQYVAFRKPGLHAVEYHWSPRAGQRTEIKVVLQAIDQSLDPVIVLAEEDERLRARAALFGRVVDNFGRPLPGASVHLVGADRTATTGEAGTYAFRALRALPYTVHIRKIGYSPNVTTLSLDPADARELAVTLDRLPAGLPAAVVAARSGYGTDQVRFEELEERLRWRSVASWVLSSENLRYQEGAPLDLLARELGVEFVQQTKARRNLTTRGVTSINIGPTGKTSRPPIMPDAAGPLVSGDACMLINGTRYEYGPLSRYSARDIAFLEIYPAGTEVTSTVSSHMRGAACRATSILQHPTYYVIWLKDDH